MDKNEIGHRKLTLDDLVKIDENSGIEYWYARDLMGHLGYTKWQNFEAVVKKAEVSCETAKTAGEHHFAEISKLITHGKGGQREVNDYKLTRYACYLIAQNGDPKKVFSYKLLHILQKGML